MSDEYKLVVRWPTALDALSVCYPMMDEYYRNDFPDVSAMRLISKRVEEITVDINDIDEEKIFAAMPRRRRVDALPGDYEPLQKEVAIQTGHFPFDGKTMILKKYETVESYKKSNGRVGFKDLVLTVWGATLMYEAEVQMRILDTKGMKWINGWRKSDACSGKK